MKEFARKRLSIAGVFILFCVSVSEVYGNGPTVQGDVFDQEDHAPVVGATVSLLKDGTTIQGCVTNREGRFALQVKRTGRFTLRVDGMGFESYSSQLTVESDTLLKLSIPLVGRDLQFRPVVVLGESRRGKRRMAGTATRVDAEMMNQVQPIGTQEILGFVPGVHGFSDDGIGNSRINVGIRGLNPRRSSRVLFLEDGIPIQPAPYVYPNMYYNPPSERIERIEVVKGSGAIEFGPQTMGGVVNYITSRPRNRPGGEVSLTGGVNGYGSLYGEFGGIGFGSTHAAVQMLAKRGNGFRNNNEFQQLNGTLKLTTVPSAGDLVYVKANGNYERSNATYTGLTEHSFENDPTFNPKDDDQFTVQRGSLDLIYSQTLSPSVTSITKAYASLFDRDWWRENDVFVRADDYEASGEEATPVPWYESGDLVRIGNGRDNFGILRTFYTIGLEQNYSITHGLAGLPQEAKLGARLHWERFEDDRVTGNAPDARNGEYYRVEEDSSISILGSSRIYETTALALHAREAFDLDPLTITAGVRAEIFEQEQVDRLNGAIYADKTSTVILPGLGANYQIGDFNLFAGIHRGYTPPSSGALTVLDFGAVSNSTGIDLLPEKSWNLEGGVRATGNVVGLELSGFALLVEDMVAAGRGTVFHNLGRAHTMGVELGGTLRGSTYGSVIPDLHFAYTYLQTEIVEGRIPSALKAGDVLVDISGNELPYAPHHDLTLSLTRSLPLGFEIRGDVHYVSRSFSDFENLNYSTNRGDTGPIPSHTVIGGSVSYRHNDHISFSLAAKNVLDEIYIGSRLHSNPRQTEAGASSGILPGGRRQVNLSVDYRFGAQ